MDNHVREALDTIRREAHRDADSVPITLALEYLRARTSADSPARSALLELTDNLASYRAGIANGQELAWRSVARTIHALEASVELLPPVRTLTTAEQLRELVNDQFGIAPDWSTAGAAGVSAIVTGGAFGAVGSAAQTKTVVFTEDGEAVAQVPLSELCAWAVDGAPWPP
jgi:hypothetical protein